MFQNQIVKVEIDNEIIEVIVKSYVYKKIEEFSNQKVFWTMTDLEYLTGCSKGYIKDNFFMMKDSPEFDVKLAGNGCSLLMRQNSSFLNG